MIEDISILEKYDIDIMNVVKVTYINDDGELETYEGEVTFISNYGDIENECVEISNTEYWYEISMHTKYFVNIEKVNRTVEIY